MKLSTPNLIRCLLGFCLTWSLSANPLPLHIFNEFQISAEDSSEWVMELYTIMLFRDNLDGCYLSNATDTVRFKDGISCGYEGYLLINSDSLQSPLSINPDEAIISLFDSLGNYLDELRYGSGGNTQISAPLDSTSLCYSDDLGYDARWYMDRSPTLGIHNDFIDTEGSVSGHVTDLNGSPLAGAVIHCNWGSIYDVVTDTSGSYAFQRSAARNRIRVFMGNDDTPLVDTTVQIYPDSLLIVDFQLDYVSIREPHVSVVLPDVFALGQNFPNPFNPETSITFDIPEALPVRLQILNIDGSEVATLIDQNLNRGHYSVNWNARNISSGMYLYQLTAGGHSQTRKMILLK